MVKKRKASDSGMVIRRNSYAPGWLHRASDWMYCKSMKIEFCKPALIADNLVDAEAVLRRIADAAAAADAVSAGNRDVLQRLLDRERITSTAIGHGVAIPHCMIDGLSSIVVGLLVARPPVAFNAPAGDKVDLFFFIVSPTEARTPHLQVLAAISRAVRQGTFRESLRRATTEDQLTALLESGIKLPEQPGTENPCRFRVLIQNLDLVQDVIEDLSAFGVGSMVVQEYENASSYLGALPLFAGLWSTREDTTIRVVEGIVHRARANELVRRVLDRTDHKRGVLVTVEDLLAAYGSLEL